MTNHPLTRRAFLAATTTTALTAGCATRVNTAAVVPGKISPNEKLNIAAVGIGGMGKGNLNNCNTENITALCDVDTSERAGQIFNQYPNAKRYIDFYEMFDKSGNDIDGVIIATPDHTHAIIAMAALRAGKHIYCQKPLAHSVFEVRAITEAARDAGVQTQMGNQGHSSDETRLLYEWIADGAIGAIRQVYGWTDRPVGGDPWSNFAVVARPKDTPPVPDTLDWDRWLGPAPYRPYHPAYTPLTWRAWYDFGTGPLGDMGCHILDPAFFALRLGAPESVQATTTHWEADVAAETYPRASIIRYKFPARHGMPPVDLTWTDGRLLPPVPAAFGPDDSFHGSGALYIGEKGCIMHSSHGAGRLKMYPESLAKSYKNPTPTLPRVTAPNHEQDWVRACKDGNPCCAPFEYGGALTEMVLLGVIASRVKDKNLIWDNTNLRFTNNDEANALINPPYRDGWAM